MNDLSHDVIIRIIIYFLSFESRSNLQHMMYEQLQLLTIFQTTAFVVC